MDAEADREIIPGAAFGNRASPVAKVSLNKTRMKTTNTDFDCSSLLSRRSYRPGAPLLAAFAGSGLSAEIRRPLARCGPPLPVHAGMQRKFTKIPGDEVIFVSGNIFLLIANAAMRIAR